MGLKMEVEVEVLLDGAELEVLWRHRMCSMYLRVLHGVRASDGAFRRDGLREDSRHIEKIESSYNYCCNNGTLLMAFSRGMMTVTLLAGTSTLLSLLSGFLGRMMYRRGLHPQG